MYISSPSHDRPRGVFNQGASIYAAEPSVIYGKLLPELFCSLLYLLESQT